MIRNLIFDFGQVLIRFEPDEMIRPYVSDQSDRALLADVVFDRAYWDRLDNDSITDEELLKSAELTGRWEKKLRQIERHEYEARTFLDELKQMVSDIVLAVLRAPSSSLQK